MSDAKTKVWKLTNDYCGQCQHYSKKDFFYGALLQHGFLHGRESALREAIKHIEGVLNPHSIEANKIKERLGEGGQE